MDEKLPDVTLYYVADPRRAGRAAWGEMIREVIRWRELAWRLFVRDLIGRYRQSVLGYLWVLIPAVLTVFLFVYLRSHNILVVQDTTIPYPAHVLFGLLVWELFTGGLTSATNSLVASGSLLAKVNFPRECLIVAAFGGVVCDFLVRASLVVVLFAYYEIVPARTIVFLPGVLFPLVLFTLGLGFILSLVNAVVRDVGNLLGMLLGVFFFLVPVIYPPFVNWPQVLLNDLNPVAAFIIAAHDVTVLGGLTRPFGFLFACFFSGLIFVFGWRVFHISEPLLAERI